jgi:adenosylcobinamide amidohydrolase
MLSATTEPRAAGARRGSFPLRVEVADGLLEIRFPSEFAMNSWAPHNGGSTRASAIVNVQVARNGCGTTETREELFAGIFSRRGLPSSTVGLMTAAEVADYTECCLTAGELWVQAIATVGLTNARSVLDAADRPLGYRCRENGTINMILATNALPGDVGRFQAIHVAAAAKATALFDAGVTSRKSDLPAALTGTDCIVVASSGEIAEDHCGLHTVVGELIGRSVHDVVTRGIALYLSRESAVAPPSADLRVGGGTASNPGAAN